MIRWPRSYSALALSYTLILFATSCGPAVTSLGPTAAGTPPAEYDDAHSTWTRTTKVYKKLESRVITSATYLSPPFLAAMAEERRRVFSPTESELATWVKARKDESARSEVFFVAVSTKDRGWNDLDQHDSMWRLYLETDHGEKVAPERIVAVRGRPALLTHFFPQLGHFSVGYWVYFPRYPSYKDGEGLPKPVISPSLSWFRLAMRSPAASADLTWKLGH